MKRAETKSPFLLACALALVLAPGTGALGQIKPGAVAARPAPGAPPPDLLFKEVQLFYPGFNLGIRLVPPGGGSQTSVLHLVEDPAVAPGTKLGPDEPNGQPGPVATRACSDPLRPMVRVWVTNSGGGAFDATTDALGLTGTIAGQPVKAAFGKVVAGQTQNFETGPLSIAAGSYSAVLALNTAHGGGETNFANNGFESRFQITCGCPAGQVRAAATGKCVAPPGTATPTPAGGTPAGRPRPTATPAGQNPLAGPTPAPTQAGGMVTTGRPVAPAAVAAIPPTPTRAPLGAAKAVGSTGIDPCTVPGAPAHVLGAVNNRTSGIVFTPAGSYHITGCGFGAQRGTATLRIRTTGGQTLEFDLAPKNWAPNAFDATLASDITGVLDSSSATVLVKGNDGVEVSQEGHSFRAARARVMLTRAQRSWYAPAKTTWGGAGAFAQNPSTEKTTQSVSGGSPNLDGFCPAWPSFGYEDQWTVAASDLKPGFVVELPIEAVDDKNSPTSEDDSTQTTNFGSFGVRAAGGATFVHLHGVSVYSKKFVAVGGGSSCTYAYHVRIWVDGPRGVAPM